MSSKKNSTLNNLNVKNIAVGSKYDTGQNSFEVDNINIRNNTIVDGQMSIGSDTHNVSLKTQAVNDIKVPVGTTLERPVNPKEGYIRYNSELMIYEGYRRVPNENRYEWIQISGGISL